MRSAAIILCALLVAECGVGDAVDEAGRALEGLREELESEFEAGQLDTNSSDFPGPTSPLGPDLAATYAEVERCTGLTAPEPRVAFSAVTACPLSGAQCCLASAAPVPCGDDGSSLCGTRGYYHAASRTIELPDGCTDAAAHEMIHHLLFESGRADWREHTAPEWACG